MRHTKQVLYGIFYVALWSALIGGVYAWKKPAATCFDGTKNQNEIGVDCGGVCSRVCIPESIAPVEVVGVPKLIPLDSVSSTLARASLVAEVRNRNDDFGASSFDYTFQVFDQGGSVIASFPDRSFIYASEIKYLVMPNVSLPAGSKPAYARVIFGEPRWSPAPRFPRPKLVIQSSQTVIANDNMVTQGVLVDQDSVDFPAIELVALYYDPAGNLVGASATELEHITVGASRDFALFHPIIQTAALEKTQVFVTAFNPR